MNHSDFVDRIYEAALFPERWNFVLDEMAFMAGGVGTILFGASGERTGWTASPAVEAIMQRFVAEGWMTRNTRAKRLLSANHPGFVTDLDVYTIDELNQDAVYVEALRPMGIGWGAATAIPVNDDLIVFSIERAYAKGPVERDRIAPLDSIRPHLARSALISSRLIFERAKLMVETLERIGLPAAVVSKSGKTIAINSLLGKLSPQVRVGANDKLVIVDGKARSIVQQWLNRSTSSAPEGASLPLPALDENPPAVAHLLPICGDARDLFAKANWLVYFSVMDTKESPSAEVMQGLFDLSPAEAKVARLIAGGTGIDAISRQLAISRETVRTQLKAVFAKTGRNSQPSLVALLAGI